ncbi:r2r3-MYB transcription factor [Tritrichomonas foetus]|uniref:R2r3-MYB transcription factor n=1 Tax=Tritrichomonas foetus TaxID=1144522 RepID=A0A1J4K2W7_9EUKA|nr:r2r3-MYB transcription factor [Tritrichomonas foetus]|eukprot:OHT03837.1 r2r3-MYB transcription factor [Tritrichomonas foetus]
MMKIGAVLNRRKLKFTEEEDEQIRNLVNAIGPKNWEFMANFIPGRSGKQIRDRYTNYLAPGIAHTEWTTDEDSLLLEKYEALGSKWSEMTQFFNGRNSNSLKNRFKYLTKKSFLFKKSSNVEISRSSSDSSIPNPDNFQQNSVNEETKNTSPTAFSEKDVNLNIITKVADGNDDEISSISFTSEELNSFDQIESENSNQASNELNSQYSANFAFQQSADYYGNKQQSKVATSSTTSSDHEFDMNSDIIEDSSFEDEASFFFEFNDVDPFYEVSCNEIFLNEQDYCFE